MNKKRMSAIFSSAIFLGSLLILPGCGKNESATGTVGAVSGAAIGTAVSGRKHKASGALLGALVGNYLGREVGKAEDKREKQDQHKQEVNKLESENFQLKEELTKWCSHCNTKVRIVRAQSCPRCGSELIKEKICNRCRTVFSPESGYKYCPYCNIKSPLQSR